MKLIAPTLLCVESVESFHPEKKSDPSRNEPRTTHHAVSHSHTTHHALSCQTIFPIGSFLIRFPVPAKIALHTAGAIGGVPGSPTPPCASVLGTMWTSTTGISARRSIR